MTRRNGKLVRPRKSNAPDIAKSLESVSVVLKRIERLEESASGYPPPLVSDSVPMSINENKVTTIVRSAALGTITGSSTIDQAGSYYTTLNSFPNSAEFINLFDEYRIMQIIIEFIPQSTNGQSAPFFTAIDYTDADIPDLFTIRQLETCQMVPPDKYFRRVYMPKFSLAAYSGTFASYTSTSPRTTWIQTASSGVQHYGLKYFLPFATGNNASWSVQTTAVFQFRKPK